MNYRKMEETKSYEKNLPNDRFQNMLQCLTKCKIDYKNEKEDLVKIRHNYVKLENELKEARELEKSHRYHLLTSREMICNLQETVSRLVYLKKDVKRLKDEITTRDCTIALLEREKDGVLQKHNETIEELRNAHRQEIEETTTKCEKKAQQIQYHCDTQIAQFTCVIEELRNKLTEMEADHREKMNVLVLEYEEKVQRNAAQVVHLQEQLTRQAAHTEANIDVYRRKLEELEEKLKHQQFKEYLSHSKNSSQYETRGERPYSVERDSYAEYVEYKPNQSQKLLPSSSPSVAQLKSHKPVVNTLQVMYQGPQNSKSAALSKANDKKGQFNITKKRKLYNEKDFLNM